MKFYLRKIKLLVTWTNRRWYRNKSSQYYVNLLFCFFTKGVFTFQPKENHGLLHNTSRQHKTGGLLILFSFMQSFISSVLDQIVLNDLCFFFFFSVSCDGPLKKKFF